MTNDKATLADRRLARGRELNRQSKAALCAMYRRGIRTPDGRIARWIGGAHPLEKWTKDEIVTCILDIELPRESA